MNAVRLHALALGLVLVAVLVPLGRSFRLDALGLDLGGLQLSGDQRVVLGAQVDLLEVGPAPARDRLVVAGELVLALELLDVLHADFELMGDPGVGTALPYPDADLVQMWAQ